MDNEISELADAVESIGIDIYQSSQVGGASEFELELRTTGFATVVEFLGIRIWFSDEDDRSYKTNDSGEEIFEPFEPFLRRKIQETLTEIAKIKVIEVEVEVSSEPMRLSKREKLLIMAAVHQLICPNKDVINIGTSPAENELVELFDKFETDISGGYVIY